MLGSGFCVLFGHFQRSLSAGLFLCRWLSGSDSFFLVGVETGFCQFDQEGVLVDGFKEAESEGVVDFVGARYYFGG